MRKWQISLFNLLLFIGLTSHLLAAPKDGRIVSGKGFEGIIFTPQMIKDSGLGGSWFGDGLWTPSVAQIRKTEADFNDFLLKMTSGPVRGTHAPTYYSSKYRSTSAKYDADFLYEISAYGPYNRQYVGITQSGKKFIFINFFILSDVAACVRIGGKNGFGE